MNNAEGIKMAKEAKQSEEQQKLRTNEKKWTKPLWKSGWTGIPNIIIERQNALGLDPIDMNIILHLCQYWWYADEPPSPSVGTIAKALGLSDRTIQKHIRRLEDANLIERVQRRKSKYGSQTNVYRLDGLIAEATPFAEEKLQEIKAKKEQKAARLSRKKPNLKVVK